MTTAAISHISSALNPVKVNVRLCGSIPRQEMEALSLSKCAPLVLRSSNDLNTNSYLAKVVSREPTHHKIEDDEDVAMQLCTQLCNMQRSQQPQAPAVPSRPSPDFEAPSWAVRANGESRLEPVCESLGRQNAVDLTEKSVFRIGRSPQSDVQLLHATSSRKHAMLFHHENGSCYIVDCNSAHGTYVNGVRVQSPQTKGGKVIPHKIRRGSMIRFGGPGAPQFMLKSFAFGLEDMREPLVSTMPTLSPSSSQNAVVQHNTRLNSLGKTAKDSLFMALTSKRSFDSMETVECEFDLDPKRIRRCSSPPLSPEREPVRLVSPDMSGQPNKRRKVSFSNEPPRAFYPALISPDLSSDEND